MDEVEKFARQTNVVMDLIVEQLQIDEEELRAYYVNNKTVIEQKIYKQVKKIAQQWNMYYEEEAFCLVFTFLRSSIVTESYEIMIALYGREMYFDEKKVIGYWVPEFITLQLEKGKKKIYQDIKKKCIDYPKYMQNQMVLNYGVMFSEFLASYIEDAIMSIADGIIDSEVEIASDFKIAYGELYGNIEILLDLSEEDEEEV